MVVPTVRMLFVGGAVLLHVVLCAPLPVNAQAVFFESATPPTDYGVGWTINATSWRGALFSTTETQRVTAMGGSFGGPGPLFLAVFPTAGGFPPNPPSTADAHPGSLEIVTPEFLPTADFRVVTDFVLPAGDWAIVLGSGEAGATGNGRVAFEGSVDIGSPEYVRAWDDGMAFEWRTIAGTGRFFLEGEVSAECGNGLVEDSIGEECDDQNVSNRDACLNSCRFASCGDGFEYSGVEECDDGNTRDGDGCSSSCEEESVTDPDPRNKPKPSSSKGCMLGGRGDDAFPGALLIVCALISCGRRARDRDVSS